MDNKNYINNNKYSKWYFDIIASIKNEPRKRLKRTDVNFIYYERHHILPKSIYPEYANFRKWPGNLVLLTPKEHFICHLLLTKMFIRKDHTIKMECAIAGFQLDKHNRKLSSKQYDIIKRISSNGISKSKLGKPSPIKGIKRNRTWNKGLKTGPRGPNTPELNLKIGQSRRNTKRIKCEYCGKECQPPNYTKWHGNKCKNNPNINYNIIEDRKSKAKDLYLKRVKDGTQVNVVPVNNILLTCPHCLTQGSNYGFMHKYHFNRCRELNSLSNSSVE